MRRRDDAAAKLHGRYISKVFKDPLTNKPTRYLGRLHFRGPLVRPYYFRVVYEDGDMEDLSMTQVKGKLVPEGKPLPEGVNIPEPATLALAQQQLISCIVSASHIGRQLPLPAVVVPVDAVELLVEYMQDTLNRPLHDRITQNPSIIMAMQQLGYTVSPAPPTVAFYGLITTPTAEAVTACLTAFKQRKAAWIACYVPGALSTEQKQLLGMISAHCGEAMLHCQNSP